MPEREEAPTLSVVVLTRNEERNIADALDSLLAQEGVDIEAIVVDSASTDGTLEIARRYEAKHPDVVRVIASERDIPIGEARNLGIAAARGRYVAQLSADAMAAPRWASEMVFALQDADIVYGRQEHAPERLTPAAVVRGLRYHHFRADRHLPPETYASNVSAGVRRELLDELRFVTDGPASALDDILFTHEAKKLGRTVAYEPNMLVRHKDATTLRGEMRKNKREGYGWGILSPQLGLHKLTLAWLAAVAFGIAAVATDLSWITALLLVAIVWAPALRRVLAGGAPYAKTAPGALVTAALVSPLFDLSFAFHYVLGLLRRRRDLTGLLAAPRGQTL